jgi:hypothetical protein
MSMKPELKLLQVPTPAEPQVRLFQVRDRATRMNVMAVPMISANPIEARLLRQDGYPTDRVLVMVVRLSDQKATYDPFDWAPARTMRVAHSYIERHWASLTTGDVIDVEFIEGETKAPKELE